MSNLSRRISVNISDNSGDDSTPFTPANSVNNLPANNEDANEDPPQPETPMNRCKRYAFYVFLGFSAIWLVKYFFDDVPFWTVDEVVRNYEKKNKN